MWARLCFLGLFFNAFSLGFGWDGKSPKLVLTSQWNGLTPEKEFVCSGVIHGYLTLPQKALGAHQLEGIWTRPDGQVAEHVKVPMQIPSPGRRTAYVWLAFQEDMHVFDGDVGLENHPYSGAWTVDVKWDKKALVSQKFDVQCP